MKEEFKKKIFKGKRVVFPKKGIVEVEDYSISAQVEDNEALIKTNATLISVGTEMNWLLGLAEPIRLGKYKYPLYPGYSNVGKVILKGRDLREFNNGDRIFSGLRHQSYGKIKSSFKVQCKIPEEVSNDEATFATLASVALYGVRRANIEIGEDVVIIGLGVVGLLTQQFVQLAGALNVITVDTITDRLRLSERLGAKYTLNAKKVNNIEKMIKELTRRKGADTVFDATGNPKVINTALSFARENGKVVIVGSPHGEMTFRPQISLCDKDRILIGAAQYNNPVMENQYYRWVKREERRLILELIKEKKLKVKELITDIISAKDAQKIFKSLQLFRNKHLGVILRW